MATCIDCGKKINRYFSRCNVYNGGLVCGECDDRRRARREEENLDKREGLTIPPIRQPICVGIIGWWMGLAGILTIGGSFFSL